MGLVYNECKKIERTNLSSLHLFNPANPFLPECPFRVEARVSGGPKKKKRKERIKM